jgi:hypothetical protein
VADSLVVKSRPFETKCTIRIGDFELIIPFESGQENKCFVTTGIIKRTTLFD